MDNKYTHKSTPLPKLSAGNITPTTDNAWLDNFPRKYRKTIRESSVEAPSRSYPQEAPQRNKTRTSVTDKKPEQGAINPPAYQPYKAFPNHVAPKPSALLTKRLEETLRHNRLQHQAHQNAQPTPVELHHTSRSVTIDGLAFDITIDLPFVTIGKHTQTLELWQLHMQDSTSPLYAQYHDFWQTYRSIIIELTHIQNA